MACLDSTFLIDFLHGKTIFPAASGEICTTAINAFEVYLGAYTLKNTGGRERELRELDQVFDSIPVLPLTPESAKQAAEIAGTLIREGRQIDRNDAMIAAIALTHGVPTIFTRNAAHFKRIPGIRVKEH